MLKIQGLTKNFGDYIAVQNIDLEVPQGEMVAIVGRSGAGKSTLLRMINRLTEPTSGQIWFAEENISLRRGKDLRRWRAQCAMIFQQFNLAGRLDVLTNTLIGRLSYSGTVNSLLCKFSHKERLRAVETLLALGLDNQILQKVETLSGGQQQRVAIAKALVQEPKIVLADEPTASLDPANAKLIMSTLKEINIKYGITIICNLHHVELAREYCSRIVAMKKGRIIYNIKSEDTDADRLNSVYDIS